MKRGVSQSQIACALVLLLMAGPVRGQDSKPYSREAAEKSFRALVEAKDKDIIDLTKDDGLVCFADSLPFNEEDRFITIELAKPTSWFQDKTSKQNPGVEQGSFYDGKTEFSANSMAVLYFHVWVNQDWAVVISSGFEGNWYSYGHYERSKNGRAVWKAFDDSPPVFRFSKDRDEIAAATDIGVMEDGSTFYATKKFENRNNGKTTYEMNIRLSTGRYKETWTPDKGEGFSSLGNCYKAKEFIHTTAPVKKTKQ